MFRGLRRGEWNRGKYERLDGSGRRRKSRMEVGRLGGGFNRRRRFWRIKITRKLRFITPKKFLIRLRDAYMNFMLRIANTRVIGSGFGGVVDKDSMEFGRRQFNKFDQKMIIEIYKSLVMAQEQLVPRDATRIGSQIVQR